MARVVVNGADIAYDAAGEGAPTFVFLHGWVCNRSLWAPQFQHLSRDHRCVALDLRGCGESSITPPYDVIAAAEDVAALIAHLKVGPAVVVGHGLGGVIALVLNARHTELVLGVVLGDSPIRGAMCFERPVEAIREAGSIAPMTSMADSFLTESMPRHVRDDVRRAMLTAPADVAAGMLDDSAAYAPYLDDVIRMADEKPLMAIWAEKPFGDPAHVREITRFVRQELIPGAGHFFQLEQPAITNALLRAFLDDVARDPRIG